MSARTFVLLMIGLLPAAASHGAEPVPAKSKIVSIDLFKNGLAVVRRTLEVPAPGQYEIADVPEPVHGTFWIESNAEVRTRVTSREVASPPDAPITGDFQRELAGRTVTIHFREPNTLPVTGKVVPFSDESTRRWDRNYQPPMYNRWNGGYDWNGVNPATAAQPGRFLVVQTESGRTYVETSTIGSLQTDGAPSAIKQRKPVLILDVKPVENAIRPAPGKTSITITYLSKGMAWAPSYRVDVSDSNSLTLSQQAVIRNEMEDFENAEVSLISGFPSVEFAHVDSPLSPRTNLANFFQQLNNRWRQSNGLDNQMVQQQAVAYNGPGPSSDIDLSATPEGEGVDLHYQPIGAITMNQGDSLMLSVATSHADYERIVEWIVPDSRDAYGRMIQDYERDNDPDKYKDAPWDAVRFRNPLPFPMTTAPAMIVSGDRFNGQRTSMWVNVGEQTSLQITKALSVRTRSFEQEMPGERQIVDIAGRKCRKITVAGELAVSNHRAETATLVVRRQFSGELISTDESPKVVLREEGVYSINRRNELAWTLKLEPGAEKTLTYRYTVLVPD